METDRIHEIIEEYEAWLQKRVSNADGENIQNVILLSEDGEYKKNRFNNIYNAINDSIKNGVCGKDGDDVTLANSVLVEEDSFIGDLSYKIRFTDKPNYDGGYDMNSATYSPKGDKIYGCRFFFNRNGKIDLFDDNFEENVWQEIQHAYVQYKILKELFVNKHIADKKEIEAEDILVNNENFDNVLKNVFAYIEQDKIISDVKKMIGYLESHEEINFRNFMDYIEDIPGYDTVKTLKGMQRSISMAFESNNGEALIEELGMKVFETYYKDIEDFPPLLKRVEMIYRMVCTSTAFAERQFYKVLAYTMEKLGREKRYSKYHECPANRHICLDYEKLFKELIKSKK